MTRINLDPETVRSKADFRININLALLGVCFTIFVIIIAISPETLRTNKLLATQLTLAIPFLITSSLARTKEIRIDYYRKWYKLAFLTFIVGYSLLINSIGILLASIISVIISVIFFLTNILLALLYSYIEIGYKSESFKSRLIKDLFFILILFFLGILPSILLTK